MDMGYDCTHTIILPPISRFLIRSYNIEIIVLMAPFIYYSQISIRSVLNTSARISSNLLCILDTLYHSCSHIYVTSLNALSSALIFLVSYLALDLSISNTSLACSARETPFLDPLFFIQMPYQIFPT